MTEVEEEEEDGDVDVWRLIEYLQVGPVLTGLTMTNYNSGLSSCQY